MSTAIPSRSSTAAKRTPRVQVVVPIDEAVRVLAEHLGRPLLAVTLDVDRSTVDRYLNGRSPKSAVEERIQHAFDIWQLVSSVESVATTRAWWMGMKDELDDLSPAEAIAIGQARLVRAVARNFVEGG